MDSQPVKLMTRFRNKIRLKHYSIRTEEAYAGWVKRYIIFHNKKHPKNLGKKHIEAFLTDLAVNRKVSASTQNQAFNALLFLYEKVLKTDAFRAKRPERLGCIIRSRSICHV